MMQLTFVDGVMEPVISLNFRDEHVDKMLPVVQNMIEIHRDSNLNAELYYVYKGVHSRHYMTKQEMAVIETDHVKAILNLLIDEVRKVHIDEVRKVHIDEVRKVHGNC